MRRTLPYLFLYLVCTWAAPCWCAADWPGVVVSEFIYQQAPFDECHASTIARAHGGRLVAAWFGGTEEGDNDVGIWLSRQTDAGWTAPQEAANGTRSSFSRQPDR